MRPCYVGDEVSAVGFRLAGASVFIPRRGEEAAALAAASAEALLVLVAAETAARIPADVLGQAQTALTPLTLIVPDLHERVPAPDPAVRLRRELGLEES